MTFSQRENDIRSRITDLQSAAAEIGFVFTAELLDAAATAARVELDLHVRISQGRSTEDAGMADPDDTFPSNGPRNF